MSRKIMVIAILSLPIILILVVGSAFMLLAVKINKINDDYSAVIDSDKYQIAVLMDGVDVMSLTISSPNFR